MKSLFLLAAAAVLFAATPVCAKDDRAGSSHSNAGQASGGAAHASRGGNGQAGGGHANTAFSGAGYSSHVSRTAVAPSTGPSSRGRSMFGGNGPSAVTQNNTVAPAAGYRTRGRSAYGRTNTNAITQNVVPTSGRHATGRNTFGGSSAAVITQNNVRANATGGASITNFARRNVTARTRYQAGVYSGPVGYSYRRWNFGESLPSIYFVRDYWISDYSNYGLGYPPYGTEWIRYGDDALLIDIRTGEILEVVYGQFD